MELIIERERWLRGDRDQSMLFRPTDGKMCCLGFFGRACGVQQDDLDRRASPEDGPWNSDNVPAWPSWLLYLVDEKGYYRDSADCGSLVKANDSPEISDTEREAQIASIFAKHGVLVVFK